MMIRATYVDISSQVYDNTIVVENIDDQSFLLVSSRDLNKESFTSLSCYRLRQ